MLAVRKYSNAHRGSRGNKLGEAAEEKGFTGSSKEEGGWFWAAVFYLFPFADLQVANFLPPASGLGAPWAANPEVAKEPAKSSWKITEGWCTGKGLTGAFGVVLPHAGHQYGQACEGDRASRVMEKGLGLETAGEGESGWVRRCLAEKDQRRDS